MKQSNKRAKSYMKNRRIMEDINGWFVCDVAMLMTNVLCFVGSREDMLNTLCDAPIVKDLPKDHYYDIGKEIANTFGKRCDCVAGEVVSYGDLQFIRLSEFSGTVQDICVLGHECLHIAEAMLRNMAIKEQENRTSELLAYTQEYLLKTFLTNLYRSGGFDVSSERGKIG